MGAGSSVAACTAISGVATKPNQIARNGLKYQRIDAELRERKREEWNQPVLWPIGAGLVLLIVLATPAVLTYRRRERMAARASTIGSLP